MFTYNIKFELQLLGKCGLNHVVVDPKGYLWLKLDQTLSLFLNKNGI